MYFSTYVSLLGITSMLVSGGSVSKQGATLYVRAVRGGEEPEVAPDNPYHEPNNSEPGGSGYSDESGSGSSGAGQVVHGTASHSTNPIESSTEEGDDRTELLEKILDAAKDILEQIQDAVSDALNQAATTTVWSITPASTATSSMPSSTSSLAPANNTDVYYAASDLSLPSIDVARELASQSSLRFWSELLTNGEYDMYQNDPVCFYANMESMYSSAASSSASAASTASGETAATITSAPGKRSVSPRQDDVNQTCSEFVPGISMCTPISGSPQWTSSLSTGIETLYGTALPDHLYSVHFATPSVSGQVTATVVSSTSCVGLNGGPGATTSYRELKVSQLSASTTTMPTQSTTPASSGASPARISVLLVSVIPLLALLFVH